jgi:tetratricopeptide (TPR) repeat protein
MKSKDTLHLSKVLLFCSLLVITAVSFWPSLFNGFFCWDDKEVPLAPFVRQLNFQNIGKYFSTFHAGLYHPLTTLSFALDYAIGDGSAFPFHVTNLLLHLANTCLLFILIRKLFNNFNIALIVALLFGVHPLHVEAVAWITSRKDLLYVFFFLGSLISYTYYLDGGNKKQLYFLSLIIFLFSCLSKIQGVVLPVALLLVDYLRNRKLFSRKSILEKIPFFLIAVLFGIINIIAQKGYGYIDYKAPYSIEERQIIFCYGFAQYVFKILLPGSISVFYPFPFHPGEQFSFVYYLYPLVLLLFIAGTAYLIFRSKRALVFGLGFFFLCIFLVLVINSYRETVITDRYTYLGSAGIFIFIAGMGFHIYHRMIRLKWILPTLGILYILAFSYLTFKQNRLWHSPPRLIESALGHNPDSPILLNTMGSMAIDSGSYVKALTYLDKAIAADKNYAYAWYHKGMAESKLENYSQSLDDFSQAITLNPAYIDAYFGRGNVYRVTGEYRKALGEYSLVLMMNRNYFGAWQDRAIVKGNLNDYKGAIDDLDRAIALDPNFGASYYLRGIAKFETQMNGCEDLRKALSLNYQPAQKALEYYCR